MLILLFTLNRGDIDFIIKSLIYLDGLVYLRSDLQVRSQKPFCMVRTFCVKGIVWFALKSKIYPSTLLLVKKIGHGRKHTK